MRQEWGCRGVEIVCACDGMDRIACLVIDRSQEERTSAGVPPGPASRETDVSDPGWILYKPPVLDAIPHSLSTAARDRQEWCAHQQASLKARWRAHGARRRGKALRPLSNDVASATDLLLDTHSRPLTQHKHTNESIPTSHTKRLNPSRPWQKMCSRSMQHNEKPRAALTRPAHRRERPVTRRPILSAVRRFEGYV